MTGNEYDRPIDAVNDWHNRYETNVYQTKNGWWAWQMRRSGEETVVGYGIEKSKRKATKAAKEAVTHGKRHVI